MKQVLSTVALAVSLVAAPAFAQTAASAPVAKSVATHKVKHVVKNHPHVAHKVVKHVKSAK